METHGPEQSHSHPVGECDGLLGRIIFSVNQHGLNELIVGLVAILFRSPDPIFKVVMIA
jgi:hypothetical protein